MTVDSVRLGEWDITSENDCDDSVLGEPPTCSDPYQDIPISNTIIHPRYDPATLENDIVLLRLSRTVEYSLYIRPACLPLTDFLRKENVHRREMYAVGFGKTETENRSSRKKMVIVSGARMSTCRKIFIRNIKSTHICAGGEPLRDSCNGDSGIFFLISNITLLKQYNFLQEVLYID